MRLPVLAACVSVATLALTPTASAGAGGTSGPLRSGGAAFGAPVPVPDARPIAARLTLSPREITAGDPSPKIVVRVRQRGIARVRARVVVVRMPGNRPVARVDLGRLRTSYNVTVRLPAALKLQTGRYLVRLHATDPRGRTLRRSGAHPGRARIVVRRTRAHPGRTVLRVRPSPAPAARRPLPRRRPRRAARASSRSPASSTSAAPARASARGAPATSTRARTSPPPRARRWSRPTPAQSEHTDYQASAAGEYVVLDAVDGRDYFFAHCTRNSTTVTEGRIVAAGTPLSSSDRPAARPARTCTSRSGSSAGACRAARRSTRCRSCGRGRACRRPDALTQAARPSATAGEGAVAEAPRSTALRLESPSTLRSVAAELCAGSGRSLRRRVPARRYPDDPRARSRAARRRSGSRSPREVQRHRGRDVAEALARAATTSSGSRRGRTCAGPRR